MFENVSHSCTSVYELVGVLVKRIIQSECRGQQLEDDSCPDLGVRVGVGLHEHAAPMSLRADFGFVVGDML